MAASGDMRASPIYTHTKELTETLGYATLYLTRDGQRVPYVFTYGGKRIGAGRPAFETACEKVGLTDVVFHDLRYTFVTNMRRAGVDYFRIMAITGHKTMSAFKRYHTIDNADLKQAIAHLDTYMDTSADSASTPTPKTSKATRAPVAQADRARDS